MVPRWSIALLVLGLLGSPGLWADDLHPAGLRHLLEDTRLQKLGKQLFFDPDLSRPRGQSCAACHEPQTGWTGPDDQVNRKGGIYEGAARGRFGNRKPTTVAYATYSPVLHRTADGFVGGNFWDGRATGGLLGNPAADQALGPFLNPLEQNLPSAPALVLRVCRAAHGPSFRSLARDIWDQPAICKPAHTDLAFAIIGLAIAAFEHSAEVSPFDSKYDATLAGRAELTAQEKQGLALFEGKAKCAECHPSKATADGTPPLFTDFTYDNLGIPANPDNPFYKQAKKFNPDGGRWKDVGLAETLKAMPQFAMLAPAHRGLHRVPTLRNVDRRPAPGFVKAFGHNGYFKSLLDFVHFYNTRDALPDCAKLDGPLPAQNCWPAPEIRENMNEEELGNLGLTPDEERALVAFLRTLSDGYKGEAEPAAR